jgi:predicted RNase H-like HicB family nuclease
VWTNTSPPPHEFAAIACPEEEGGFSIFAANYPGVISQGDTLEEATANIAEAFLAVLDSRRRHGEAMEFSIRPVVDIPNNCVRLRIKIDG